MRLTPSDVNLLTRGLPSELDPRRIKEGKIVPQEPAEPQVAITEPQHLVQVYDVIIKKANEILDFAKKQTKDLEVSVSEIEDQDILEAIRHLFGEPEVLTSQMYFELLGFADGVGEEMIQAELDAEGF